MTNRNSTECDPNTVEETMIGHDKSEKKQKKQKMLQKTKKMLQELK